MTHCVDFFCKWKEEPNFCGIGKAAARDIERYLDFVEGVSTKSDLPTSLFYKYIPVSSAKPILTFKEESGLRQTAVDKIIDEVKKQRCVSLKNVKKYLHIDQKSDMATAVKKSHMKHPRVMVSISKDTKDSQLQEKIRLLKDRILTSGQISILQEYARVYHKDNEYAALTSILIQISSMMKVEADNL